MNKITYEKKLNRKINSWVLLVFMKLTLNFVIVGCLPLFNINVQVYYESPDYNGIWCWPRKRHNFFQKLISVVKCEVFFNFENSMLRPFNEPRISRERGFVTFPSSATGRPWCTRKTVRRSWILYDQKCSRESFVRTGRLRQRPHNGTVTAWTITFRHVLWPFKRCNSTCEEVVVRCTIGWLYRTWRIADAVQSTASSRNGLKRRSTRDNSHEMVLDVLEQTVVKIGSVKRVQERQPLWGDQLRSHCFSTNGVLKRQMRVVLKVCAQRGLYNV